MHRVRNERTFFLFDKALLITKKRGDHFVYKGHIPVTRLLSCPLPLCPLALSPALQCARLHSLLPISLFKILFLSNLSTQCGAQT